MAFKDAAAEDFELLFLAEEARFSGSANYQRLARADEYRLCSCGADVSDRNTADPAAHAPDCNYLRSRHA